MSYEYKFKFTNPTSLSPRQGLYHFPAASTGRIRSARYAHQAEDDQGVALGFIHLQAGEDYYYDEPHGHIANLIVAPEGEGHGIGQVLIEMGEAWARLQGFRWLTLSVFAQNLRAREIYQRLGVGEDIMRYVKELP